MKSIKNKVIVITGAGSGIGRGLAELCASEGALLALNDFNKEALAETVALVKPNCADVFSRDFDVSKKEDFHQFAEDVIDYFGHVDVVINNAGVALGKMTLEEVTYEQFEWLIGINMWGVIYGTKAFLPNLKTRPEAAVVNISSLFGLLGIAEQTAYCTSKFAVRGFTEALRMELLDSNVVPLSVHPGGIKTNIAKSSKGWSERLDREKAVKSFEKALIHSPEKAAKIIMDAVKKKRTRVLIGQEATFGDILARTSPEGYSKIIKTTIFDKI